MNGFRLRGLRKLVGLRQTEVASELGVDNETVCRWEKSGRELTMLQGKAIDRLIRDPERIAVIKLHRPPKPHKGFTKNWQAKKGRTSSASTNGMIELTQYDSGLKVLVPAGMPNQEVIHILTKLIASVEAASLGADGQERRVASESSSNSG